MANASDSRSPKVAALVSIGKMHRKQAKRRSQLLAKDRDGVHPRADLGAG
jgi:hypothetical protein